jgi:preprotein translocase subunit SecA
MPLEARMVTKAIERAQHTVEDRNFEIRKDVLKYDEVMNEQRKIIYRRRQQILDGEDLRDPTIEAIQDTIDRLVTAFCPGEFPEDWDLGEFHRSLQVTLPSEVTLPELEGCIHVDQLRETVISEALAKYETKEESIGKETLREIERRVMLSVIDQRWREHLYEMDYLREGINLRAMGQQDPLAEWQREGYDMFEAMMAEIEDDFVRYVTHLQVVTEDAPDPLASSLQYSAAEDPVQGSEALRTALATPVSSEAQPTADALPPDPEALDPYDPELQQEPVRVEKTPGRNEPCFCGSGKKYKLCHGR